MQVILMDFTGFLLLRHEWSHDQEQRQESERSWCRDCSYHHWSFYTKLADLSLQNGDQRLAICRHRIADTNRTDNDLGHRHAEESGGCMKTCASLLLDLADIILSGSHGRQKEVSPTSLSSLLPYHEHFFHSSR